jgi:hypothetical protein
MIVALINVFRRASLLRIPTHEPIGQYRQKNGVIICLRDKDVRDILCAGCIRAYPNSSHYCRLHINGIVAHSNRVTAALCLYLGGASIDEIAFRLRWEPGSVPTYGNVSLVSMSLCAKQLLAHILRYNTYLVVSYYIISSHHSLHITSQLHSRSSHHRLR